jgi:hypothetical protein
VYHVQHVVWDANAYVDLLACCLVLVRVWLWMKSTHAPALSALGVQRVVDGLGVW